LHIIKVCQQSLFSSKIWGEEGKTNCERDVRLAASLSHAQSRLYAAFCPTDFRGKYRLLLVYQQCAEKLWTENAPKHILNHKKIAGQIFKSKFLNGKRKMYLICLSSIVSFVIGLHAGYTLQRLWNKWNGDRQTSSDTVQRWRHQF